MILLYEHPLSPYAQKVKVALLEKDIPFESRLPRAIGTGSSPHEGFTRDHPRLEVPLFVDGETRIFDSSIILEYLEDRFPQPPLLPRSAEERARARTIEEVMDTHYEAINWGLAEVRYFRRAEGELATRLEAAAADQTRRLQAWLERQLGERDWFGGAAFGWADLAVVPHLDGSAGFGLAPPAGTPLSSWLHRANARPSVARARAEAASAAAAMAGGGAAFACVEPGASRPGRVAHEGAQRLPLGVVAAGNRDPVVVPEAGVHAVGDETLDAPVAECA